MTNAHWLKFATGCALVLPLAAQAAVMVTDLTGKPKVGELAVTLLAALDDGKEVELPDGARMVAIDLASGREYKLRGPGRYLIEAAGPRTLKGAAPEVGTVAPANLPSLKGSRERLSQATLVMRSIRKPAVPLPTSPVRTMVVEMPPTLRWGAVEGASEYRITLTNDMGDTLHAATTSGLELAVPAKALAPGQRYHWRVEARAGEAQLAGASATFNVAAEDVIKQLVQARASAGNDPARRVLYALQLQDAGATDDARRVWRALAAERPDDEQLRRLAE